MSTNWTTSPHRLATRNLAPIASFTYFDTHLNIHMNSFSKWLSYHRPRCNALGAGFSSYLVHFLQVLEQRSDRAVYISFSTLYTTQHHYQLYLLNPVRAVTKALRPHAVYLFIGPGCAHSLVLLCLASTTLGQSEEQGVYSYHVLGDCTEQTLHVTTRKFTCHGTGSGKGGGSMQKVHRMSKNTSSRRQRRWRWWCLGGWVCLLPFLSHNFRLENTWHQIRYNISAYNTTMQALCSSKYHKTGSRYTPCQ